MSSYKVLQDIEAEDKLLGPLTLRQFIYAAITVVTGFIAFKLLFVNIFLIVPFVPVVVLFGVLAAPFGNDQPNEVWLLAKIRFFLVPRKRIWNQGGVLNLVEITAPKVNIRQLTKNMSEAEVQSRLHSIASTIDSHGWSVKNVAVNLASNDNFYTRQESSDRLVEPSSLPKEVPSIDITEADDMLDTVNNASAQKLDQMISASGQAYKQKVIDNFTNAANGASQTTTPSNWFVGQSTAATPAAGPIVQAPISVVTPTPAQSTNPSPAPTITNVKPTVDDSELLRVIKDDQARSNLAYGHMKTLNPAGRAPVKPTLKPTPPRTTETVTTDPAILGLALANNDNWSVATIAHQAEQAKKKQPPEDEVVISLH